MQEKQKRERNTDKLKALTNHWRYQTALHFVSHYSSFWKVYNWSTYNAISFYCDSLKKFPVLAFRSVPQVKTYKIYTSCPTDKITILIGLELGSLVDRHWIKRICFNLRIAILKTHLTSTYLLMSHYNSQLVAFPPAKDQPRMYLRSSIQLKVTLISKSLLLRVPL